MRARGTVFLAVAVLGLGLYLWLVERGRPTTGERAGQARRVVSMRAGDVDRIAITRGPADSREMIRLQRDSRGQWQITAPVTARGDAGRAAGLATQVEFLESERIASQPDRKALGLDPPRLVLALGAGADTQTLSFGERDATGRRVYVEAGGAVHAVDPGVLDAADKPASEFRDHRVLPVESFRVQSVSIERGEERLALGRTTGEWWIEAPLQARADKQEVERLVERLTQLRAETFLADAGEVETQARIALTLDDGTKLGIGLAGAEEGLRRALLSDEGGLVEIKQQALVGVLPPDIGLLQDRQLFHLAADRVDRLVLGRGKQRVELSKREGEWTLQGSAHTVAGHRVDARIRGLTGLRAERVAPIAGDDAHPMAEPAFVELGVGEEKQRVDLVAFTGEGEGRELRLVRHGEGTQSICKAGAEALFAVNESDFLSGLAEPGHEHVHEHGH